MDLKSISKSRRATIIPWTPRKKKKSAKIFSIKLILWGALSLLDTTLKEEAFSKLIISLIISNNSSKTGSRPLLKKSKNQAQSPLVIPSKAKTEAANKKNKYSIRLTSMERKSINMIIMLIAIKSKKSLLS